MVARGVAEQAPIRADGTQAAGDGRATEDPQDEW